MVISQEIKQLRLVAVSEADISGRRCVVEVKMKDNEEVTLLVEPPYLLEDAHPQPTYILASMVAKHNFSVLNQVFSSYEDFLLFLKTYLSTEEEI